MTQGESVLALPKVVLDTNAVLDWLLFADSGMVALRGAIESGRVRWIASPRMREELLRTLGYTSLAKWVPDSECVLATFDRWAWILSDPEPTQGGTLICSDPDDQVFIDLALAHQARWLVTHDRALHKLARRAMVAGVTVLRPNDWPGP